MTPPRTLFQRHLASKSPNTQRVYLTSFQRLETWADRNQLDIVQLQTADLERFLAEEGRRHSSATIEVRRAALRAFYRCLENADLIELDPSDKLRLAPLDHLASIGPVAYLSNEAITRLREHALQLGAVSSLAICMLHETPATVTRIAGLTTDDFAQDARGKTYATLGQSTTTNAPWPISQQILGAVETLRSDHLRLISPLTKNPNILMVKSAIEQTRLSAGVQTPNLAGALKHVYRRRERELCTRLRLQPSSLSRYKRPLVKAKDPLTLEGLSQMLARIPTDTHADRRDRALLLMGIAGALRRSELVALDVDDIQFVPEGMLVSIRKSKINQGRPDETLVIAHGDRADLCAVHALKAWLGAANITSKTIFRRVRRHDVLTTDRLSDRSVAMIVKKHAEAVGLDPTMLAGHSLRSGGVTAAARQ
jgi:site-specific recombinase XerD